MDCFASLATTMGWLPCMTALSPALLDAGSFLSALSERN
jgi:hypothetical protein